MSRSTVQIVAPSRLHFGLCSFGRPHSRQFGGVGVMIDRPGIELQVTPAEQFSVRGPLAERAVDFARQWAAHHGRSGPPACEMTLRRVPPQHSGLGVGTQLALSVAAALEGFEGRAMPATEQLAVSVGRGRRSAVGSYGFVLGGLIAERGKTAEQQFSPLDRRLPLPCDWRFVLVRPPQQAGLSGWDEQQAFRELPAVPKEVTERLVRELYDVLLPAAEAGDFPRFSESLYRYGHQAGLCFAARQGGPYNGPRLNQLVERIRSFGAVGVGQSSWGPTLFALVESCEQAEHLAARVSRDALAKDAEVWISGVCNSGARVTVTK